MWNSVPTTYPDGGWFHLLMGDRQIPVTHHPLTPERIETKSNPRRRLKVFIVEDERLIAENLKIIVEDRNWRVVGIAASGEEAVLKAQQTKPDLILMDVRIQGELDGVHAARMIQESVANKPRILFLSAHGKEQFPHLDSLDSNSFSYLKKPYTPEELVAAIELLISQFHNS